MTLNQKFGYAFGAVYVLVGLAGFAVTTEVGFLERSGDELIVFEVNPLHNIIHLAIGTLLAVGAAAGARASRATNLTVGTTYLLVALVGFFILDSTLNILALNQADNFLHIATAVVALGIGLKKEHGAATA